MPAPHASAAGLADLLHEHGYEPAHVASVDRMTTAVVNACLLRDLRISQACRNFPAVRAALVRKWREDEETA